MLANDTLVKPLLTAEILLCIPVVLLGLAGRQRKRGPAKHIFPAKHVSPAEHVPQKAPVFSPREKAAFFHWAQAFCLGMMFALCGAVLWITHEHSSSRPSPSVTVQTTSTTQTAQPAATPQENR